MICLALDLATKSGWAIDDASGNRPELGTYKLAGPSRGQQFLAFERWLYPRLDGVDLVAVERPIFGGGKIIFSQDHMMVLIGLVALTHAVAASRGLEPHMPAVSTVRRHFCRSGKAKKSDVQDQCWILGWDFDNDDNQADAAALWSWAKSSYDPGYQPAVGTRMFAER